MHTAEDRQELGVLTFDFTEQYHRLDEVSLQSSPAA